MSQLDSAREHLSKLQAQVDLTPYQPLADSPSWLNSLANSTSHQLGALALLGPPGINVSTTGGLRLRALLDSAGLFLAGLSCQIRASGKNLAIGLPPASRHLPLLIAGSAVLDDVLLHCANQNTEVGGKVLVISPDLDVRSRYCDLYVQSNPLDDAYPGSRMLPTGDIISLQRDRDITHSNGVCFFLPGLQLPKKIYFTPSMILLDLRYARWSKRSLDLVSWVTKIKGKAGLLALYSIGDRDTYSALDKSNFIDLPFDHAAIATCIERVQRHSSPQKELSVNWRIGDAPAYLKRQHEIIKIQNGDSVSELISKLGGLLDEHSRVESPDLNRARWLLAMFSQIPVPLVWYEQAARSLGRSTLRRMISYLGIKSRHLQGLGAVMQTLRMQLENLHQLLERSNPRAEALKSLLANVVSKAAQHERVLLLVRDRVMGRALGSWLEVEAFPDAEWLENVDVKSCSEYARVSTSKYAMSLINGSFPRRYRWIAGASLGDNVTFLAYPHEVEVIEYQLQDFYSEKALSFRRRKRAQAINQICLSPGNYPDGKEAPISPLELKKPSGHVTKPTASKKSAQASTTDLSQLKQILNTARQASERIQEEAVNFQPPAWKEDAGDDEALFDELETTGIEPHVDDVVCLSVQVSSRAHGVGLIWLATDVVVECVRANRPNDILRLIPDELLLGDVLLRMDEGGRTSLFDRIVELAEDQPEMQYLATFRHAWRRAVQRLVARFGGQWGPNYVGMLLSLQSYGATIQSDQTVRSWVQDYVIGPDEVSSIIAVGRASGSEALVRQAKQFDAAFRRIRGIRQGIGRRLNSTIRKSFRHFTEGTVEPGAYQLDERLGIPLDELLETIDLAEIISVNKQEKRIALHHVGRFRHLD